VKCQKCGDVMVESNITFESVPDGYFYNRYFCFNCDTLYECSSDSGDFIEEYLNELGEVDYE